MIFIKTKLYEFLGFMLSYSIGSTNFIKILDFILSIRLFVNFTIICVHIDIENIIKIFVLNKYKIFIPLIRI